MSCPCQSLLKRRFIFFFAQGGTQLCHAAANAWCLLAAPSTLPFPLHSFALPCNKRFHDRGCLFHFPFMVFCSLPPLAPTSTPCSVWSAEHPVACGRLISWDTTARLGAAHRILGFRVQNVGVRYALYHRPGLRSLLGGATLRSENSCCECCAKACSKRYAECSTCTSPPCRQVLSNRPAARPCDPCSAAQQPSPRDARRGITQPLPVYSTQWHGKPSSTPPSPKCDRKCPSNPPLAPPFRYVYA